MNIYKMKINGVSEIEQPLDIKKDYSICLKRCSVKSITKTDTGEEDCVYTHNLENVDITTIIDEGKTIKGQKKGGQSKLLRFEAEQTAEHLGIDSEKYYKELMSGLIEAERLKRL